MALRQQVGHPLGLKPGFVEDLTTVEISDLRAVLPATVGGAARRRRACLPVVAATLALFSSVLASPARVGPDQAQFPHFPLRMTGAIVLSIIATLEIAVFLRRVVYLDLSSMPAAQIELAHLQKSFGRTNVIPDLSATIDAGSFTVILGPSGCGKSTLLNMIAGLEDVSAGTISIDGRAVQNLPAKDRGLAMVFQNYALYPHMSVADNIGYALKVARVPKPERRQRVARAAKVVSLSDYLDRRPGQLSGGQRQRVAIARAIVREPRVLLFDEPLSNLDAKLRHSMRMELSELHKRIGATSVFVTHDQVEAMTLADKIMVLSEGSIQQYGTPQEIYHQPATTFVAEFIGAPPMNLIPVEGREGQLHLSDGSVVAQHDHTGPLLLGIRPEHVATDPTGVPAKVVYSEDLGSHAVIQAQLRDGQELRIATQLGLPTSTGAHLTVHFPREALNLFDPTTKNRIA